MHLVYLRGQHISTQSGLNILHRIVYPNAVTLYKEERVQICSFYGLQIASAMPVSAAASNHKRINPALQCVIFFLSVSPLPLPAHWPLHQ